MILAEENFYIILSGDEQLCKKIQYVYPNSERFENFSIEIKGKLKGNELKPDFFRLRRAKGKLQQFFSVKQYLNTFVKIAAKRRNFFWDVSFFT